MSYKKVLGATTAFVFLCAAGYVAWQQLHPPVHFYIVTPSYNNEKWCLQNLQSVVQQSYPYWKMIILVDGATDKTAQLLREEIAKKHLESKVMLVENKQRVGACRNIYDALYGSQDAEVHIVPPCPDKWVVCILDGDDFYTGPESLARVAQEYKNSEVWMTYGNYVCWPEKIASWCVPLPEEVARKRLFRKVRWFTAHHRTYYAWLLKKIKKEDLMYDGEFLQATCDMALTFPALEMASRGHIRFIPEAIYVYNVATELNDYKIRYEFQERMHQYIRGLPVYEPL